MTPADEFAYQFVFWICISTLLILAGLCVAVVALELLRRWGNEG